VACEAWHDALIERCLVPHASFHYVGESNTTAHREWAEASFSPAAWARLGEVREKFDPERLFVGFD
jgi:FAD/FMN-containing dehydrogenase